MRRCGKPRIERYEYPMPLPASEYAYALGSEASAMGVSWPQFRSSSAARSSTERAIGALSESRVVLTSTWGSVTMRARVSGGAAVALDSGGVAAHAAAARPIVAALTIASGTGSRCMARSPFFRTAHPAANTSSDERSPG